MYILGIKVDEMDRTEALAKVVGFLNSDNRQYKIFTPNPEMVVKAQKDEYFKKVLNSGDLNLCDGMGLYLVSKIKRIPGVDFMIEICKIAAEQGRGVYLLGSGNDEIVKKTAKNLQKQFPKLKIIGYDKGPEINEKSQLPITNDQSIDNLTIQQINQSSPEILFVAFGMGKQEKWIFENLAKMPGVKIAIGVGGAFDYIAGKVKRAPCWMRKIGLEWMYRLIQEPRRLGRIFNATIIFTLKVLVGKFKNQL